MNISPAIELIEYTDPYCTWCWGSEPILRHIQEVYKEQVHVSFVMGGLTDDTAGISDPANGIGGADWKHQVAAHWLDASSQHGMPVDVSKFVEIVARATKPQNFRTPKSQTVIFVDCVSWPRQRVGLYIYPKFRLILLRSLDWTENGFL